MSLYCRVTVVSMLLVSSAACAGHRPPASPVDPFAQIDVSRLAVAPLGGTNVLLLVAGGLVAGDSLHPMPDIEARRSAILGQAYAALDTAIRRDGREVNWLN